MSEPSVVERSNLGHQLFGAICGLIFTIGLAIGWFGFAHGYLPAKASWTPEQTAEFFQDHHQGILIGCTIWLIVVALLTMWSAQLGLMLWQLEGRWPLLAITQVLCSTAIVGLVSLSACFWIGAAYRPGTNPDILVALNDGAQFGLLLTWPLLSVQMIATSVVTLKDRSAKPIFPRWLAQVSILGAISMVTLIGPAFTKTGIFAYHGLLGYYVPGAIWALWLDAHSVCMVRAIVGRRRVSGA